MSPLSTESNYQVRIGIPAVRIGSHAVPKIVPVRAVKIIAWLNLLGNLLIIATGGAVRLTGSGLGCTSWPFCQEGTGDWHSVVEFSNRGVGAVLGILAILAVVLVWRHRRTRKDLWIHAWILLVGVVVEGLLGMVTVYVDLNAWSVGIHFLLSAILIGVATSFVIRAGRIPEPRVRALPLPTLILTHLSTLLLALVVIGGVLTTSNGPHSGDENVIRDSSAWEPLVHVHAWLAYALGAALLAILIGGIVDREWRFVTAVGLVIGVVVVQIVVGILQARLGLPPILVGVHMVLAGLTVALGTLMVDRTKTSAGSPNANV